MSAHDERAVRHDLPPPSSARSGPRRLDAIPIVPFDDPLVEWVEPELSLDTEAPSTPPRPPSARWRDVADLLDHDGSATATLAPDGSVLVANRSFLTLLGADATDHVRPGTASYGVLRSLLDHVPNELLDGPTGGVWRGEVDHHRVIAADDGTQIEERLLRAIVEAVPDDGAHGPHVSLVLHDVTDARRRMNELHEQATTDPLTGLANRHHILGVLGDAIESQRDHQGHVVAIFIDLDHLKYVNDAFGHRAGDRLLASTASRLANAVRPIDHVARIGGDEFLVVGSGIDDAVVALELAERIRRSLTGHLRIGELDLEFSVSVGIALTDVQVLAHGDDAASVLVSNADTAMYAAKQAGRGRSVLYSGQMRAEARERTEIASTLARAMVDEELSVEYQPVYSTVSKRAVGAEALVRWNHPRLGRMDPATFVAVAEESGTIGRLGEQVLARALDDLAAWRRDGTVDDGFAVHVNVSRVQLSSGAFVNTIVTALKDRGLSPRQLVLEARETSLLGRATDVDRSIRALRRFGVQIAVDNFGSGPKALAVMTDIGADVLKLDGSLALPTGSSDTDTRLVRAIVLLAHALEMDVVAERVASPEQLARLRAAGCDLVQGNLLATPAPADRLDLTAQHGW